jgi:hypothetical protein
VGQVANLPPIANRRKLGWLTTQQPAHHSSVYGPVRLQREDGIRDSFLKLRGGKTRGLAPALCGRTQTNFDEVLVVVALEALRCPLEG